MGFVSGVVISLRLPESYVALIQSAAGKQATCFGLILTGFLPFVAAYFSVYFSKYGLLYPIGFLKTFSFSLCAMCIYRCFGSAGFLVRGLFQFTDILLLPVLYWYSLRHLTGVITKKDSFLCFFLFLGASYLEYRFVSPFLAMLIEI